MSKEGLTAAYKKLITVHNELTSRFVGRDSEVVAVLAGLITGEPTILVSPPGTAKTMMIETLARMVGAKYFYYLLTKFTEPDELLGPLDIEALKKGEYRRITTNRLPDAEIVFLDEIFKASSAIRNTLLDIILNKRFLNGTRYQRLDLLALYTASNEVSKDAEDRAFYDRLLIRAFHGYVPDSDVPELLEAGLKLEHDSDVKPVMSVQDVRTLQDYTMSRATKIHPTVRDAYIRALMMLRERGIELSDRRKVKCLKVAAAISIIYGGTTVSVDDVADALRYVAPGDFEDVPVVEEVIMKAGLLGDKETIERLETLRAEAENLLRGIEQKGVDNVTMQEVRALVSIRNRITAEVQALRKKGSRRVLPYLAKLLSTSKRIEDFLAQTPLGD